MEAFSLLRYWRGGGAVNIGTEGFANFKATAGTTTMVTSVDQNEDETDYDDGDDGPFFDLEFAVPDEEDNEIEEEGENGEPSIGNVSDGEEVCVLGNDYDGEVEGERDFNFTLSSDSSDGHSDPNLSLSPSDDLFIKGKLVPNSKSQFPVSLLKSATKFRVFTLGHKKSRSTSEKTEKKSDSKTEDKSESKGNVTSASKKVEKQQEPQHNRKFFTVKFKVEEVPIVSLFTRDNSSRVSSINKLEKQSSAEVSSEEKRFSKEAMQKYLKMVKPLYIRVSRRYGEKLRFSGQLSLNGLVPKATTLPSTAILKHTPAKSSTDQSQVEPEICTVSQSNTKSQKQMNLQTGLRVVCKHLGKNQSAASIVASATAGTVSSRRRDDSLLQQQDGIQSAILHCKRSFNASRDSESSVRLMSASDPMNEKGMEVSIKSSEKPVKVAVDSFSCSKE